MMITAQVDQQTASTLLKRIESARENGRKALKDVVNAAAKETKEEVYRRMKTTYTIKSGVFKKADIRIRNASVNRIEAVVRLSGGALGIQHGYSISRNTKRNPVKAKIRRNGTAKPLELKAGGHTIKAFITKMESGYQDVFQRVPGVYQKNAATRRLKNGRMTKGRQAIRALYALSRAKAAEQVYLNSIQDRMQEIMSYQMNRYLNHI